MKFLRRRATNGSANISILQAHISRGCAQASERTKGYVFRAVRPQGFSGGGVGYRAFRALRDALLDLGLIEKYRGFQKYGEPFGARVPLIQKATRFRATRQLLDLCERHGVRPADFHQHFLIPLPEDPLQLHGSSRRSASHPAPYRRW